LLQLNGKPYGSAISDITGAWVATPITKLTEGVHTITATQMDAAGNTSAASAPLAVTIDLTPSAVPTGLDLPASSDTGVSAVDNLTNLATPQLYGKGNAGDGIAVFSGATQVGTGTVKADGSWLVTLSKLADGAHGLTAKSIDVAGNVSAASAPLTVTIDTQVAAPTGLDLTAASDTGALNNDNITMDTTPTIAGKGEAGATVTVFNGAAALGKAKVNGAGVWSFTTAALPDGVHTLKASQLDAAGNASGLSDGLMITIDTIGLIPTRPDLTDASDTGISATDNLTRVTTPTFTGKTEANASVSLQEGTTVLATGKADASGEWTLKSAILAQGAHDLTVVITDVAGNISPVSAVTTVTIDTTPPAVPSTPDLTNGSDSGASNTDNRTNVKTPVFSGKAELGTTVTLFSGSVAVGSAKTNSSGIWAVKTTALADGTHLIGARAFDAAGNQSALSGKLSVVIDTVAPAEPDVTTLTPSALVGVADPGSTITVMEGATKLGTAITAADGTWTIATVFATGTHAIEISAADTAGNTAVAQRTVFIGTTTSETIPGGAGADIMAGQDGNDVYDVNHLNDLVIEYNGHGSDTIRASVNHTLAAGSRVEFLTAASAPAGVVLGGNERDNEIVGSPFPDTLIGFVGADTLTGGAGADVFRISAIAHSTVAASGRDLIVDFSLAQGDKLDFSGIDANTATLADDPFTFIGAAPFTSVAGQLRSVAGSGFTTVSGDVNGDGVADFAVRMVGNHTLSNPHFML
jgi:Ca2+-binding RTX toxin-like protein